MMHTPSAAPSPTIKSLLGAILPRGSFLHTIPEGYEFTEDFIGGKMRVRVSLAGRWTLTEERFATADAPSSETGVASGPDLDGLAATLAREIDLRTNGVPVVGGGATFRHAADHHACTIVQVDRNAAGVITRVVLQRDRASLLNGVNSIAPDALQCNPGGFIGHITGTQRYTYAPDPGGVLYVVTPRVRNGRVAWVQRGQKGAQGASRAHFLAREEHYDFNL